MEEENRNRGAGNEEKMNRRDEMKKRSERG
jgi:hypothetical protein